MDYSGEVLRRFGNPVESPATDGQQAAVATGEAQDRALGVWVRFQVGLDRERIEAVRFQVFGCPHTIAAASLLAERLAGQPRAALAADWAGQLAEQLDVPEEKLGRLLVLEDALRVCARRFEQG